MKSELFYLLLTAILTGLLWIPVVIGYVTSRGVADRRELQGRADVAAAAWVNRANRAHENAVENFAPFAAVVLVAPGRRHLDAATVACAAVYFYARLAHARRPHQRHRPAQGAHATVHDRLGRVPCLRLVVLGT